MNRLQFLQKIAQSGLLLTVPLASRTRPKTQSVPIYEAFVRGFQYHAGMKWSEKMRAGDELHLVREPKNAHDPHAVAVFWKTRQIGYLPYLENVALAAMLDRRLPVTAQIRAFLPDAQPWERCLIGLDLLFPIDFLVEMNPKTV